MTPNLRAFLDMIAHSEIGSEMLAVSDNGYNVIVGSRPNVMILMSSYADHPRRLVQINPYLKSTAAGRYQLMERYFDPYKKQLGLTDFGHASQDAIAAQQIKECHALSDIEAGRVANAIEKCNHIWASLPGSEYGQHVNRIADLVEAYKCAGGSVCNG